MKKYKDKASWLRGEWTVRNKITFIDPSVPTLTIADLEPGAMFQYVKQASADGVYMRLSTTINPNAVPQAVHLPTGNTYFPATDAALVRVTAIQITSPIS